MWIRPAAQGRLRDMQAAAQTLGLQLRVLGASTRKGLG
jgi:hypothetical protein